ncbi:MAG: thermonuclease family protein [archaeon]
MNPKHIIITILFLTSLAFYYQITEPTSSLTTAQVTKIIDGDTLETNDTTKIRLLGINTPEKNQPLYQEAKDYLTTLTQNQTIQIESYGPDKYQRTLAHIFLEKQNINAKILSNGLATLYYYEKDSHYKELQQAEEFARNNNLGLWEKSPNTHCLQITNFQTDEPESLILKNSCNKILNISYKDDATHIYQAIIKPNSEYTNNFSHIWNTEGDSIYIYDTKGLILFQRY